MSAAEYDLLIVTDATASMGVCELDPCLLAAAMDPLR